MTGQLRQPDELSRLLIGLTDAGLDGAERLRLVEMLRDDPAARSYYLRYMLTDAVLRLEHAAPPAKLKRSSFGGGKGDRSNLPERPEGCFAQIGPVPFSAPAAGAAVEVPHQPGPEPPTPSPGPLTLPIIIDTSSPGPSPPFFTLFAPGGWLFSYAAAVVITGMLVLSAWVYRVSLRNEVALAPPAPARHAPAPPPEIEYVGRIAGTADCRLADPHDVLAAAVPLGRRYDLASGLMEIAYQSGARVILQGPCSYEVDSAAGGFLSLGKLTARVEAKGEGGRGKAEGTANPKSEIRSPKSPFPLPPSTFVVRTPTAVITDLGTEFGVEVSKEGNTTSHVFRGKVELRVADGSKEGGRVIPLEENESASVDVLQGRVVAVAHRGRPTTTFVRGLPKWERIRLWNTGVGLKEGAQDPHWQLVARTDEPKFRPRAAVVTLVRPPDPPDPPTWLANDPASSQWISAAGNMPELPDNVTYTFRTTFEFVGLQPNTALLRIWYLADDYLAAIRLNGRPFPVPEMIFRPFLVFRSLTLDKGFVEGENVLEFDVFNGDSDSPGRPSSGMGLRVEMEGYYWSTHRPSVAAKEDAGTRTTPERRGNL